MLHPTRSGGRTDTGGSLRRTGRGVCPRRLRERPARRTTAVEMKLATWSPERQSEDDVLTAATSVGGHIIGCAEDWEVSSATDPMTQPKLGPWLRDERGLNAVAAAVDRARLQRRGPLEHRLGSASAGEPEPSSNLCASTGTRLRPDVPCRLGRWCLRRRRGWRSAAATGRLLGAAAERGSLRVESTIDQISRCWIHWLNLVSTSAKNSPSLATELRIQLSVGRTGQC